ncbi:EscN/YscN/HrcN family type III secretion system ATPase, partial [Shigella flexneri]|nr:EscN/YscN/HrcN family type III secretion system ATPase [Shigella flexneri]
KPGENASQDKIYNKISVVESFLKQDYRLGFTYEQTMELIGETIR